MMIQILETNPMEIHSVDGPQFIPAQPYNPDPKEPDMDSMIGQTFGRWTVTGEPTLTQKRERKWLCRCSCGTERYVLERSLRSGGSTSCGCRRREAIEKASVIELTGQSFGELTVLERSKTPHKNGGVWWRCRCACGEIHECPGTLLTTGKRTHCTGKAHKKNYYSVDITGQQFGRLTALYATELRDEKGGVIWHCRCDCGNEMNASCNRLMYSNLCSCGCLKKEYDSTLSDNLTYVANTSVDRLRSKKLQENNTTGHCGVYFVRGRYVAKISFQRRSYYLGAYKELEDAVEARQAASEQLFDGTVSYYDRWKARAEEDPQWAEENPIRIRVKKKDTCDFTVTLMPVL